MAEKKQVGHIIVDTNSRLILLTRVNEGKIVWGSHLEMWDYGITLDPFGSSVTFPSDDPVRIVSDIETLVGLLKDSGVDLTPAEVPLERLPAEERIKRLEQQFHKV